MGNIKQACQRIVQIAMGVLMLSGCASYGVVENRAQLATEAGREYSIASYLRSDNTHNGISVLLAFSGGGSRAAALSYGVLEALRDSRVMINGEPRRLLDEVDIISSVSGGSFTAAYYGLYGERIFDEYRDAFLIRDMERPIVSELYNPLMWFSSKGRTEIAVKHFDDHLFHGATFADMIHRKRPLVILNATDLGRGVRFSFIQEYFNLLCSDVSTFPVSRAVVASSAVPVLFNPVVLQNHPGCMDEKPGWLLAAKSRHVEDSELTLVANGLETLLDKESRKYIHLVDGGITDNLGLRALYELTEIAGGVKALLARQDRRPARRIAVIVVDASTEIKPLMDMSNQEPTLEETVHALTDAQLHRYSAATLKLWKQSQQRWSKELSTPEQAVTPYFIKLGFREMQPQERRQYYNQIPTNLSLSEEQVDGLIEAGRELLYTHPVFLQLLDDLMMNADAR